jgi:DNA-binding LacI/PurR family transcriptional regulator
MSIMSTIKDVACRAKVSPSTVSRALKGSDTISVETRRRIKRIAEELGYVPNRAAQILIGRKRSAHHHDPSFLSIVYESETTLNDSYFSTLIKGMVDEASRDGFATAIFSMANTYDAILSLARPMRDMFTAGVILVGNIDERLIPMLLKHCSNIVIVDKPSRLVTSVINDNERGAHEAVSYLVGLGVKRIALIHGPPGHYFSVPMRTGYRRALVDAGIPFDPSLCAEGRFRVDSGYHAMKKLLRLKPVPEAVFSNDEMGVGAIKAIKEEGLRIPEDVMVFGFDNLPVSSIVEPNLSTVKIEYEFMSRTAVRKAIENSRRGKIVPVRVTIPVELIIRESTRRKP